jgi:restriction endonuclease S subunit
MMKRVKLGEIASIRIGLLLSRKLFAENLADLRSSHTYRRLLPKSLQADGTINLNETEAYESRVPLDQSDLTRAGTIVMKLSYPFNPVLVTAETENLVVPSQMAVLVPHGKILPEYIRIYLSREAVAERLLSNYALLIAQKGVTIQTLADLIIEIPSKENQERICNFYAVDNKLHMLRAELNQQEQKRLRYIFSALSKDEEV